MITSLPENIGLRLAQLEVGACTCLTKSPDIQFHAETCRYRLIVEVQQLLAVHLEPWFVGDRVIGRLHRDNPARITKMLDGEGFEYELETPHDLGPRHGRVFNGKAFTREGWKRLPPVATEDTERLDWLDSMNRNLNSQYGTTYRWEIVLSPNVVRLTNGNGRVGPIDLNDSSRDGSISCRQAIDAARRAHHN